jgi:hypothetical protein
MNKFNINLAEVSEKKELNRENLISEQELQEIEARFKVVKEKVERGEELSLEDARTITEHFRAIRKERFVLKEEKERKAKKLSRVKMVELFYTRLAGKELTKDETADLERSLAEYKGKKLSKKDLNNLLVKEHTEGNLDEIELKDKQRTLFPEG